MLRRTFSLAALGVAVLPGASLAQPSAAVADASSGSSEDARLNAFFEQASQERLRQSPEQLTLGGSKERYGELGDYTEAAQRRSVVLLQAQLAAMKRGFDRAKLGGSAKLSYDLFERVVATAADNSRWYWQFYAVTSNGTALNTVPIVLITAHRMDSEADAEAYIARLRAVERVAGEVAADIDQRTVKGYLPPAFIFKRVVPDAESQLKGAPFDSGPDHPVWADLKKKVAAMAVDPSVKSRLQADAEAALKGEWRRGYTRYIAALEAMASKATTTNGVWALPNGEAFYAAVLRNQTTTNLTPDQVHQIGLAEVARIRGELEGVKARIGFAGPLEAFFDHVRTDPQFQYPNTEAGKQQCLADGKRIIADYMAVANKQFAELPKLPLEVRAVEPFREKTAPAVPAYQPGTPDGSRPGIVYFNLSDMTQVLKPQIPVSCYHEGAPGHHFQMSRALEQSDLPTFRRNLVFSAYAEGWGVYCEKLAKEAGFYRDPYDDFGRLSFELWRAVRLVVDTGIHAKRWDRDRVVDYMRKNTLNSDRDLQSEVDRYFTQPGQACSYKIGQLKISALRERATAALGDRFDIRDFHEAVLSNGSLPLDMLEAQIDMYVARAR